MDEIKLATHCLQLATKDLGLKEIVDFDGVSEPFDWLEKMLEIRIKEMLDSDFIGLMNAFYRIDIPEKKVQELLELSKPEEVAIRLAKAVIEREKQKVITREQYRSS